MTPNRNPHISTNTLDDLVKDRCERDPAFAVAYRRSTDRRELARALHQARRAAGLSQAALAARVGTKQAGIARLESGRSALRVENLRALAEALGYRLVIRLEPLGATPPAARPGRRSKTGSRAAV